jgi:flagellar FliJ protein
MREQITQVSSPNSWVCARIEQIKSLILELGRESRKLSCDLEAEETRVGISDPNHYAYPPLAKTLRERRDRLEHSIESLMKSLEDL